MIFLSEPWRSWSLDGKINLFFNSLPVHRIYAETISENTRARALAERLGMRLEGQLWLLWRAHADLGRNWSPRLQITEEHRLVTQGVYAHIRHPIYAAVWLTGLAQLLMLANWIAGPACLILYLPGYLVRVPREEGMMRDHFGDEYRAYAERTGAIFPTWFS